MDKITIYNRALSLIAAAPYQPQTGVQHPCDTWLHHAILKTLDRADWSFARRRATLTADPATQSTSTNSQSSIVNTSSFTLPEDCLKIRNIYHPGTRTKTSRRETYGRTLVTETTPTVDIDYTATLTDQELYQALDREPTYCQALIYLLASLIAPEINGSNTTDHERYAQLYEQELHTAIYLDRKQTDANDQSPLPGILARRTW